MGRLRPIVMLLPCARSRSTVRAALLALTLTAGNLGLGGCSVAVKPRLTRGDSTVATLGLDEMLRSHWEFVRRDSPELSVWAGLPVDRLPDVSYERAKVRAQFARAMLYRLDEARVDALRQEQYVTWLALRWDMDLMSRAAAFHWTDLTSFAPDRSPLRTVVDILAHRAIVSVPDAGDFLRLLRATVPLVDSLRTALEVRKARGVTLSRYILLRAVASIRAYIAPASDSPFGVPPDRLTALDSLFRLAFRNEVRVTIETRLNPALDRLATYLERDYAAAAPTQAIGLGQYPGGLEHYRLLVQKYSTLNITPEDAHGIGLEEVVRLDSMVGAALRAAALPQNRDSVRTWLRSTPGFEFIDNEDLRERFIARHARADSLRQLLFLPPSGAALQIDWTPAALEASSPLSRYVPPSVPEARAHYQVTAARWRGRSMIGLGARLYQDLIPGRHLQNSIQRSNAALPAFRRAANYAGFIDGWGMYALDLVDSLVSRADAEDRIGVRLQELANACGLVVDTGINYFGWTREQALAFLRLHLADDDEELEREFVIPVVEEPGSLTAAALGGRELRGFRRWAQRELGDRFVLPAFHLEVLALGALPLPVLGSHLEWWIWKERTTSLPDTGAATRTPERGVGDSEFASREDGAQLGDGLGGRVHEYRATHTAQSFMERSGHRVGGDEDQRPGGTLRERGFHRGARTHPTDRDRVARQDDDVVPRLPEVRDDGDGKISRGPLPVG